MENKKVQKKKINVHVTHSKKEKFNKLTEQINNKLKDKKTGTQVLCDMIEKEYKKTFGKDE